MKVCIFKGSPAYLMPVALRWKDETNIDKFGFEESYTQFIDTLRELINDEDKEVLVLLDKEENPVGFLGLYLYQLPLSKELICSEHMWYVLPEYRRAGGLLVKVALQWAKEKGCQYFQSSASKLSSDLHDHLCQMYEKFGMQHFETIYIKSLKDEQRKQQTEKHID